MPRLLTTTIELSDEEFDRYMARLGERSQVAGTDEAEAGEAPPAGQTVDRSGVPWLEAVHATTKTQTKEGRWTRKKGVTDAARDAAEAAFKASNPAGTFHVPQSIANVPGGVNLPNPPVMPMPAAGGMPPMMPAPAPFVATYEQMVAKYTELANAGKITTDRINQIYRDAGVIDPNTLVNNETQRTAVYTALAAIG